MQDSVSWGCRNADCLKERNPAMEKYRVTLTPDERHALEKLVSVGNAAARKLTHARILLLADTSHELTDRDDQIVLALGTSLRSVERIRKRFVPEGLDTALNPKPQPPALRRSKSRGTSRSNWCIWPAATRPRDDAIGLCTCWQTNWSS